MTIFTDPFPCKPEYDSSRKNLDIEFKFYLQEYIRLNKLWLEVLSQHSGDTPVDDNVIPYDVTNCAMCLIDVQAKLQQLNYYWNNELESWKLRNLTWDYSLQIPTNTMLSICLPDALYPINLPILHTEDSIVTVDDNNYFYVKVPMGGLPKGTNYIYYSLDTKQYHTRSVDSLYNL